MHPNRAFEWTDLDQILSFVSERAFAHIFTATEEGLFVVHAPVVVQDRKIRFHVSKRNRIADQVANRRVLISVSGREGYQSANWYAAPNQVPTWHYEAVELEGDARVLTNVELATFLDDLSAIMEQRHSPERPWTRDKMEVGAFEAMTRAIIGFEVEPANIRGTRKFNQHKSGADLDATIEGQRAAGRGDIIDAIRELSRCE
jgi:transcriptional regulator